MPQTKKQQVEDLNVEIVALMLKRKQALRFGSEKEWDAITDQILKLERDIKATIPHSAVFPAGSPAGKPAEAPGSGAKAGEPTA